MVRARESSDEVGLIYGDQTWTWRQVVTEAACRAEWLCDRLDPARPPHVGVLLPNVPEYVFQIFGAALAGACIVGLNATRPSAELARDIDHTDCQFVIANGAYAALVNDPLLVEDEPWAPHAGAALPDTDPPRSALMCLLFTSGSTSAPKAVLRSQGRTADAARMGLRPKDTVYCPMSLCHGNALSSTLFPALAGGARVLLRDRFSATAWLPDVRRHDVTFTATVGRALGYILATPPTQHDRDHRLRFVLAPEASPRDMSDFVNRFGVKVISGYGSSEGGIMLMPAQKPGSLGVARDGDDIAVVDASGGQCPTAQFGPDGQLLNSEHAIGELVRRNPAGAFEGYWKNPEAEGERLRGGWFWSGDLAYRDGDGVFWFAGRVGDWLRVDSENFAASPVERILVRYDDVAAVAVVGVPDPLAGDQVMAVMEFAQGREFDADDFVKFLDAQRDMGSKWAPRFVRFSRGLPIIGNSKVNKRQLRREAWVCADPVWWRPPRTHTYTLMTEMDREILRREFLSHGRIGAHPDPAV
ncbi:AMP-binding protein [Mycobacterium sp. 94-17]|uniref:AMP-binding protein n=1 Tax=Mycobacterium sp. 94-17 TaxID=2986147 RepID=UPI002D1F3F30|nr:AMP-binding protein [Mycobacterium sp. 94-17]MEB4208033.1 AMP-binding protein [Mycobacterium sp. 94-17]